MKQIKIRLYLLAISATCWIAPMVSLAQWSSNPTVNTPICNAINDQWRCQVANDGSGGAIIVWPDYRSGSSSDIYVQRVDASGVVQWTMDGVVICTASNNQGSQQIVTDGLGGAIIIWADKRTGSDYDIYAQRVNSSGVVQWAADGVSICTAPNDPPNTTVSNG